MRLSLFRRTTKKLLNFWEILKDGQSETKIRVNLITMAERKTKMIEGPVCFDGPLESLPHYNKNQIITCTCENCKKQFTIKFCNLKKKLSLLCKSCGVKLHTPYQTNGDKISKAKKDSNGRLSEKEHYERFVAPQLNRSEEEKRKSIESYKSTIRNKSQEEISLMKSRMRAAKATMTDDQKRERERKFLKSFYESQGDKIRNRAERILNVKEIGFNYLGDFEYECYCERCKNNYIWSPLKKNQHFTEAPHCPNCQKNIISHYEIEICNMLDKMNVAYIHNDRNIIRPKELDVYIPSLKIAIEFDGIHWHSDSTKNIEKEKLCEDRGIRLIDIFENEYDFKKVNSLLQSLAHASEMIYARKCILKELPNEEYMNFCNENHIQNYAAAKVRLGLFYNGELIQIMSFSKPRFNKKYEWEIIRECTKCGYGVVGGKEKLFKNFVRLYDPRSIISYCDKRYFTGESYLKLGMKQLPDTSSSYVYAKYNCATRSRYMCQKQNLKKWLKTYDSSLSQYDNMIAAGYSRMYDFGQHVFEWTNL